MVLSDAQRHQHGPRTPDGLQRIAKARTKHGAYGSEMRELRPMQKPRGKVPPAARRNPPFSLPRKSMQKLVVFGMEQSALPNTGADDGQGEAGCDLSAGRQPAPRAGATEAAIRERLAAGVGMLTIAAQLGVGSGTVQRVKRELVA